MEENILNLIGWELSRTLKEIEESGCQAKVNFTCPIKGKPTGRARVIRLTKVADKIVAVVAARQVLSEGGD